MTAMLQPPLLTSRPLSIRSPQGIMNILETPLAGVIVLEPRVFRDARGYFFEMWSEAGCIEAGLPVRYVQDNVSYSARGVLRGLHFQHPHAQGKLISVLRGEIFDVAVDIRVGSPTFLSWTGAFLSADNRRQLYIPEGFAHGFVVTGDDALVHYKCTDSYHPDCEASLAWDDPDLAITWPVTSPILSPKDASAARLGELGEGRLPKYGPEPSTP